MKVMVIGGGWSGCAAALSAAKQGASVTLAERTDMLLGTGLVGGIFRNNGRWTAAEEMIAMGGGDMFRAMDSEALHTGIEFPGHRHASLYSVATIEPVVRKILVDAGVSVVLETRITDVEMDGRHIRRVATDRNHGGRWFEADAFVETTGTGAFPQACNKYGNGCAMCVLRCPTFGTRVSIAAKAGVTEMVGRKGQRVGAMSGSCKLFKESLAPDLRAVLERDGVAIVPIPGKETAGSGSAKLAAKACQQYALAEFEQNVILLDTGHAKLMTSYYPLDELRAIPGFANARYEDPYAGGIGNSIRYLGMSPRDDFLKVEGVANLFCAGEKAGLLVGHTEAVATGVLAGCNAARWAGGLPLVQIPRSLCTGDAIAHVREEMQTEQGLGFKYTFSGSVYFERMKQMGLYVTDVETIRQRVAVAGLTDAFARPTAAVSQPVSAAAQ
jgi:hypothetical protein